MAAKVGIQETVELLDAVRDLVDALDVCLEDGKLSLADLPRLFPLLKTLETASEGISKIPEELKDLDAEEIHEIADKGLDIIIIAVRLFK
jgi:hypothetical protein